MEKDLEPVKDAFERNKKIFIVLEMCAETGVPYKERIRLANERARVITDYLSTKHSIAPSQIKKTIAMKAVKRPSASILIYAAPEKEWPSRKS